MSRRSLNFVMALVLIAAVVLLAVFFDGGISLSW